MSGRAQWRSMLLYEAFHLAVAILKYRHVSDTHQRHLRDWSQTEFDLDSAETHSIAEFDCDCRIVRRLRWYKGRWIERVVRYGL
jgi:hypothetical protein